MEQSADFGSSADANASRQSGATTLQEVLIVENVNKANLRFHTNVFFQTFS